MNYISAKIIADSIGPNGARLTTFELHYPRCIHGEFMTHRQFSRNAASSRAIPIKRMNQLIIKEMFEPIEWGSNKPGMQAGDELTGWRLWAAKAVWRLSGKAIVHASSLLAWLGLHKQYANRITEPFSYITVIVTATNFANFYALRIDKDAQPEIQALARAMYKAQAASTPRKLAAGHWHLPYVTDEEQREFLLNLPLDAELNVIETWLPMIKISVARCARVSYLNHSGKKPSQEEDLKLYDRLVNRFPLHSSSAEHTAMAMQADMGGYHSGNLIGWFQYRKSLKDENITEFEMETKQLGYAQITTKRWV